MKESFRCAVRTEVSFEKKYKAEQDRPELVREQQKAEGGEAQANHAKLPKVADSSG